MKHRIIMLAGLGLLGATSLSQAAPLQLSALQMDSVAAGLSPSAYRSIDSYASLGAAALASSSAVATPSGTAVANASISTSVGLAKPGFTSSIGFAVLR